jgi:hypothetical protein
MSRKLNTGYNNIRSKRDNVYHSVPTQKFSVFHANDIANNSQQDDFNQDEDWDFAWPPKDISPDVLHRAAQEEVMLELIEIAENRQCVIDLENEIQNVRPRVDKFYKFPHVNVLVSNN